MVGVPVIINHKDLNKENADDERVGVVNSVWYDEKDGWYWCDGIIWDETAQNLITDKNWSVSCSYDVKTANDEGGSENNIKYDMEFLDGVFTHLALVNNPRYERANIVFNSKTEFVKDNKMEIENENDEKGKWVTIKGTHVFIPDGKTIDEVVEEKFGDKANKQSDKPSGESNTTKDSKKHLDRIEKLIKKYNLEPHEEDELLDELGSFEAKFDEGLEPREEEALREELFDFEEDIKRHHEMKKDEGKDKQSDVNFNKKYSEIEKIIKDKNWEPLEEESALEELEDYKREFNKNLEPRQEEALLEKLDDFKNKVLDKYPKFNNPKDKGSKEEDYKREADIALTMMAQDYEKRGNQGTVNRANELKEKLKNGEELTERDKAHIKMALDTYKPREHTKEAKQRKKTENSKEQDMALIEELKKLITKVENEKGDDMADDKEKNEVENENVDKRKLIDEVGGILKGKVDDEVIRTIIGKLEKVAYDKSEAGTADNEKEEEADNKKCKNEDDEKEVKEVKEDVKEDVENKCKNSVDNSKTDYFAKLNEIYNSASQAKETTDYVSRADREKAAEDYFAK